MAKKFSAAFYKSKLWRAAREMALRRDLFTCCDCGGRAEEIHHKIELTPDNITDPTIALGLDNLESLCHNCHTKRTLGGGDVADGYAFDESGHVVLLRARTDGRG